MIEIEDAISGAPVGILIVIGPSPGGAQVHSTRVPIPGAAHLHQAGERRRRVAAEHADSDTTVGPNRNMVGAIDIVDAQNIVTAVNEIRGAGEPNLFAANGKSPDFKDIRRTKNGNHIISAIGDFGVRAPSEGHILVESKQDLIGKGSSRWSRRSGESR